MSCSYCHSRKRDVATCACGDTVCGLCFYPRICPRLFQKMVSNKGKDSHLTYACDVCCQDMHMLCLICEQSGDLVKCISCRGAFHTRCHRMDRCAYCFKASQDKDAKVLVAWCVDLFGKIPGKCIRVRGELQGNPSQYYESSNVIHAIEPNLLVGRDFVVHLRGPMCRRLSAISCVMPVVAQSFQDGFPQGWKETLRGIAHETHKTIDESQATQPLSNPQPTLLQRLRAKSSRNTGSLTASRAPANPSASSSVPPGCPSARYQLPNSTTPAPTTVAVSRSPDPIEDFTSCSGATSFGRPSGFLASVRESIGTFSHSSSKLPSAQAKASSAPVPMISSTVISISDSPDSSFAQGASADGSFVQAAPSDEVLALEAPRDDAEAREIRDSQLVPALERTMSGVAPTEIMSDHEQVPIGMLVDDRDGGGDDGPLRGILLASPTSQITTTEEYSESGPPVRGERRTLVRVLSVLTPTEIVSDGGKLSVGAPIGTLDCRRLSFSSPLDSAHRKKSPGTPAESSVRGSGSDHTLLKENCAGTNVAATVELSGSETLLLPSDPRTTSSENVLSSHLSSTEIPHRLTNSPTTTEQHPLDPPPTVPNTSPAQSSPSLCGHRYAANELGASPIPSPNRWSCAETLESTPFMSTMSLEREYDSISVEDNNEEGGSTNIVQEHMSPSTRVPYEHSSPHIYSQCREGTLESTPFMSTLSLRRSYETDDDGDDKEEDDRRGGDTQRHDDISDSMQSLLAEDAEEFHSTRSKNSREESEEINDARRQAELEELQTNGTESSERREPIAEAAERGFVHYPSSEDEKSDEDGRLLAAGLFHDAHHEVALERASADHLAAHEDANQGVVEERDVCPPLLTGGVEEENLAGLVVHEVSELQTITPKDPNLDANEEAQEDAAQQRPGEESSNINTPPSRHGDRAQEDQEGDAQQQQQQHDLELLATTPYKPSVGNANAHEHEAKLDRGASTDSLSDLNGAGVSEANNMPPQTLCNKGASSPSMGVSSQRHRSLDHTKFQGMLSLLDSTNSLPTSSQSPTDTARGDNMKQVMIGASDFPHHQLVHRPNFPASRRTDSILRASTVPLSYTNYTSDGYSPHPSNPYSPHPSNPYSLLPSNPYSPHPSNPSLAHKLSESVSPHAGKPFMRVPGLDLCLSGSNSALLKAPVLLELTNAATSLSLPQDDASEHEGDGGDGVCIPDARAAETSHPTDASHGPLSQEKSQHTAVRTSHLQELDVPVPQKSADDLGVQATNSPLGSVDILEVGFPPKELSGLRVSTRSAPSSPSRNHADNGLPDVVDTCGAQLSKDVASEREEQSGHTLGQATISLITSSGSSGSQASPSVVAFVGRDSVASEVNDQNIAAVSAVNEPIVECLGESAASRRIGGPDPGAGGGPRIRADGDACRAEDKAEIIEEGKSRVALHSEFISLGKENMCVVEHDDLQAHIIDANSASKEPHAHSKPLAVSATPVRQQDDSTSCSLEKPRERKSQAMLWREIRTQIRPPNTRQRSSSSEAAAVPSPKRRKNMTDPVSVPLSPSPTQVILSAHTENDTQNQSAQTVCTNQDVVLADVVHDKRATEAKVYEELVDIDALRWYVHSKVDRRQPVAEEFLTMAEKAAHRGTTPAHGDNVSDPRSSIRRIPMTYHRSVDMGRRYADKTSLQSVTRECRAAASGSLLCDIDISNCYPVLITQMVDKCMRSAGKPLLKIPTLRQYITAREDLLATVTCRYGVPRDAAKNLFLRLLYGGTISSWRDEFGITIGMDVPMLFSFQTDAAEATRAIVASRPDVVARFAEKRDSVRSVENCALAYILGETEDLIVSTCEEVLERDDVRVSVVVFDGLMVDMSSVSEEELASVLHKARNEIREKLGFSVIFERKMLIGCAMQARMTTLGGTANDIAMAKEHDAGFARSRQKVFEMFSTKKHSRVSVAAVPKKKRSRGMVRRVRSRSLIDVEMEGAIGENENIGCAVPWSAEEKKQFSSAMGKLDISDPSFWQTLSKRVGRTLQECKQYYNAQRSCSGSKRPAAGLYI
eukprot:GEMP01000287.1.p1 GENE.GEMP01000287.1~~GEMP01000287.1.p1  ORF type:complete len:2027 (-),score=434.72 GEMP01000287.1:1517-7597(-)